MSSTSWAHDRPYADAYSGVGADGAGALARPAPPAPSPRRAVEAPGASITSVDPRRGVPSFLWASREAPAAYALGSTPEAAARTYLARYAPLYDVSPADVATARVAAVHDTGRGGIIVTLRQHVGDVEIYRSDVKLLLDRDRSLLAISGSPRATAADAAALAKRGDGFRLDDAQALARALGDLFGLSLGDETFVATGREQDAYRYYDVAPAALGLTEVTLRSAPRSKRVYYALPDRLVPAYYLELEAQHAGENEGYAYVISALDGGVLARSNLVAYDAFTYRVYADDDAARHYPPADSPFVDSSPRLEGPLDPALARASRRQPAGRRGVGDGANGEPPPPPPPLPGFAPQRLVSQAGFNTNPQ
ncbi:MAG TPA: hypothetical protein VFS00_11105, partial [Polyangiaceae bacterium]|nr:hypothetical protein [Polyangiaceae bacterium]